MLLQDELHAASDNAKKTGTKTEQPQKCMPIFPPENDQTPLREEDFSDVSRLELFSHINGDIFGRKGKSIDELIQQRSRYLREQCKLKSKRGPNKEPMLPDRFGYFPNQSFLYCAIAKCGNTAWFALLKHLEMGRVPVMPNGTGGLINSNYALDGKMNMSIRNAMKLAQYKVAVVRHPVLRLLSGFDDIVIRKGHSGVKDLDGIVSKCSQIQKKYDLSLLDSYIHMITESNNRHFWSYEKTCSPCNLQFDTIIHIDDLKETSRFFNGSKIVTPKSRNLFFKAKQSRANYKAGKSLKDDWKTLLSQIRTSTFIKFLKWYQADFELFGYKIFKC